MNLNRLTNIDFGRREQGVDLLIREVILRLLIGPAMGLSSLPNERVE